MFRLHFSDYISSAHFLPNYEGKCKNIHGHNWKISVICEERDIANLKNGMVIDFSRLKQIIGELDHKNLNELGIENPTAENIAKYLYDKIPNCIKVTVTEKPNQFVEYTR